MNRPGTEARRAFVAALFTAIAGSAPEAKVHPELGGDEAAAELEAKVAEARQQREPKS